MSCVVECNTSFMTCRTLGDKHVYVAAACIDPVVTMGTPTPKLIESPCSTDMLFKPLPDMASAGRVARWLEHACQWVHACHTINVAQLEVLPAARVMPDADNG